MIIRVFALLAFLICSCHTEHNSSFSDKERIPVKENTTQVPVRFAKGFTIKPFSGYRLLEVMNPWQGAENISFRYALVEDGKKLPRNIPEDAVVIHTPVKRIVCTSTTHIALLEMVDELQAVVGVSGSGLISNKEIRKKIKQGVIRDVGYDRNLNYEILVSLKPDLVMMYGVESEATGFINKLDELGIPVVMNGEYLEKDPLAKLEWVRFVASFFNKDKLAETRFDSVATCYRKLRELCDSVTDRPVVMTGLPWKEVWYISPGNTTLANYIKDAGGSYLWKDLHSGKAVPMDVETVYAKSASAEFWINTGTVRNKKELLSVDTRFKYFKPVQKNNLYNNIGRVNGSGGNDFWELGLTHPQDILSDLIYIFHPELLPGHKLFYYRKLN